MGAETRVMVKVRRVTVTEDWVEVSAIGLDDAKEEAAKLPGVVDVLSAQYEDPADRDMDDAEDAEDA